MAKLSPKEQKVLDQLNAKAEAPESAVSDRRLNISIDLGDDAQVAKAQKLGLLDGLDDDGDDDDGDDDGEGDGEETPRRRGYFAE